MRVVCLEGCHGCGKTTVCKELSKISGIPVLDEAFLDMPDYALHPQSLTMESAWVSFWFQRILKYSYENKDVPFVIADRSPWSAVVYTPSGHILDPVIRGQIQEMKTRDISIECVYLNVKPSILWDRLVTRVNMDPGRKRYKEDDQDHMFSTLKWYNSHLWDYKQDNNDSPSHVAKSLFDDFFSKT